MSDFLLKVVHQAAESTKVIQDQSELLARIATEYGLRIGYKTLRKKIRQQQSEYIKQKRNVSAELKALLRQLENGEISPEEYRKQKVKLEEKLYEIEKAKEQDKKLQELKEKARKVKEFAEKLFERNKQDLQRLGYEIRTFEDISEIPEWIRRPIEKEIELEKSRKTKKK